MQYLQSQEETNGKLMEDTLPFRLEFLREAVGWTPSQVADSETVQEWPLQSLKNMVESLTGARRNPGLVNWILKNRKPIEFADGLVSQRGKSPTHRIHAITCAKCGWEGGIRRPFSAAVPTLCRQCHNGESSAGSQFEGETPYEPTENDLAGFSMLKKMLKPYIEMTQKHDPGGFERQLADSKARLAENQAKRQAAKEQAENLLPESSGDAAVQEENNDT